MSSDETVKLPAWHAARWWEIKSWFASHRLKHNINSFYISRDGSTCFYNSFYYKQVNIHVYISNIFVLRHFLVRKGFCYVFADRTLYRPRRILIFSRYSLFAECRIVGTWPIKVCFFVVCKFEGERLLVKVSISFRPRARVLLHIASLNLPGIESRLTCPTS